jgi:hypothetical protein
MINLIEQLQIACGFVPVNMASAANDGDWVSLKSYQWLLIVLFKGAGTAGEDPTITVEQATTVAGGGAKALNFTEIYKKQGADLFAIGQFTKVTQAAGNTFTDGTLAEEQAIVVVPIKADTLDTAGGFDCVRGRVADVGASSQIGGLFYLLGGARTLPPVSAIVD